MNRPQKAGVVLFGLSLLVAASIVVWAAFSIHWALGCLALSVCGLIIGHGLMED